MEKRRVEVKERAKTLEGIQVGIKAPRGSKITCKSWQTEAALRMLMNNLDPGGCREAGRIDCLRGSREKRLETGKPII